MKKFMTLLLAAGMVVSAASGASAADLKVSGTWLNTFAFADGLYGEGALIDDDDLAEGHFMAKTRLRLNMDFVASEALSGRMQLQAGAYHWGKGDSAIGEDGNGITARLLYVDWLVPNTDVQVRMGRQEVAMPSYTFGSPVIDEVVDGVTVSAPINDMVAVNFGWMRPWANSEGFDTKHNSHGTFDLAFLGVDVTADGFAVSPWFMAGRIGSNAHTITVDEEKEKTLANEALFGSDNEADLDSANYAYWAGIGAELTLFDPFKFTADFIYSANDADRSAERKGWYAALGAEMATSFATPFLRGWYASGDDADSDDSGRFFGDLGGGFDASSIYFDANGFITATVDRCNPNGTWGVQLGLKDLSFLEGLTHELSVSYIQGTNNTQRIVSGYADADDVNYLTTSDSLYDITFLSSYEIYKNLSANLLIAYMITDLDENLRSVDFDNGFRGALNFTYKF